jgi:TonB family protein
MRIVLLSTLLAAFLSDPSAARQQESSGVALPAPASTYSNTTEGLKGLLQDMRTAARDGNEEKLAAFLKNTEVPNCDAWLHKMYDSDKADSWMSLCDAKFLASKEKFMHERFVDIAGEDGEIFVRKVNDNPEPGKGLEWGLLHAIRQPLDIYSASWKTTSQAKDARGEPFGYFVFVEGGFRWDSLIQWLSPAKLVKKVEPVYPPGAASQPIVITVRVSLFISSDGSVRKAQAISGEGYSDDSSFRKAAEEAVMQWRYKPATLTGRPIETNTTVDVTFSPKS